MNIPEEQRKLIKAVEEIKDMDKLCEYLNANYPKMSGLDKKTFIPIDGIIYQISTVDLAHGSETTAQAYEKMYIMRYETIVFRGLFIGVFDSGEEIYKQQYKTEEEALAGHKQAMNTIRDIIDVEEIIKSFKTKDTQEKSKIDIATFEYC